MDADATAALNQKGIAVTDDSFKFIWCKVDLHFFSYLSLDGLFLCLGFHMKDMFVIVFKHLCLSMFLALYCFYMWKFLSLVLQLIVFLNKFTDSIHVFFCQDHESVIKAIYTGSKFIGSAIAGNEVGIVLESTSFYAEQGGQVLQVL